MSTSQEEAPRTVLVVEDDEDIREAIAELLAMKGCAVLTAGNGRAALEQLQSEGAQPSVILLDLMMPEMDGWQFRAEQRQDPRIADIPVVILTAHASANEAAANLQAAAVLRKPVDLPDLLAAIVCTPTPN